MNISNAKELMMCLLLLGLLAMGVMQTESVRQNAFVLPMLHDNQRRVISDISHYADCQRKLPLSISSFRRKLLNIHFSFFWFGGKETKESDVESEDMGRVKGIMETMDNFRTSQRVGERASNILQDLSNILVEGSAADGKIKVTFNGQQKPVAVNIDEAFFLSVKDRKGGVEDLNDALTKAMQDAHAKSSKKMEEKLKSFYNDLGFKNE